MSLTNTHYLFMQQLYHSLHPAVTYTAHFMEALRSPVSLGVSKTYGHLFFLFSRDTVMLYVQWQSPRMAHALFQAQKTALFAFGTSFWAWKLFHPFEDIALVFYP